MAMSLVGYNAPSVAVVLGDVTILEVIDVEVCSSRLHPMDRACVKLRPGTPVDVLKGQDMAVLMGYDGEQSVVWTGRVVEPGDSASLTVVGLDGLQRLQDVRISQSWTDCTPGTIAAYVLAQAGLVGLVPVDAPVRHHFVLHGVDGLEALQQVNRAWELGWDLYGEFDRCVYFGPTALSPRAQTEEAHRIERGVNLLDIRPAGDLVEVACVFNPFLMHSEPVIVHDPDLWGEAAICRAERVRHSWSELRTEVQCRRLA